MAERRLEKATKGRVFGCVFGSVYCAQGLKRDGGGEGVEGVWRERVDGGGYGAKKTVVMPRATEIRRNFNIRWRIGQEGAGDVIPLTNGRLLPDAS